MLNVNLDPNPKINLTSLDLDIIKTSKILMRSIMSEVKGTSVLTDQPGMQFGIEETKDVILFGVSAANAVIASLKDDGKITVKDFPNLIAPMMKLPAALSGLNYVPAELADLTEVEKDELIQFVKANLEVDDAKAQAIIQKSIEAAYSIYNLVKAIER